MMVSYVLCSKHATHLTLTNISAAETIFSWPIWDAFSFISRKEKFNNPSVWATWWEAWAFKEDAMRAPMPHSLEKLNEHAR